MAFNTNMPFATGAPGSGQLPFGQMPFGQPGLSGNPTFSGFPMVQPDYPVPFGLLSQMERPPEASGMTGLLTPPGGPITEKSLFDMFADMDLGGLAAMISLFKGK